LAAFGDKQQNYKDFPVVGAFSHKCSVVPSDKTIDWIKKVPGGVQKWDEPRSMVMIVGRTPAIDEKV